MTIHQYLSLCTRIHMRLHRNIFGRPLKVHSLLGDALSGEVVLKNDAEHCDQSKADREHSPVGVGRRDVQRSSVVREHITLQQDRNHDTGADTGSRHHGRVGHGSQKASLVCVTCGQGDHRTVCCVIAGIRDRIVQVIADRDPDHLQRRTVVGRCEHQNDGHCHERDRSKQIRTGFTCRSSGVIDPLSYHQVPEHNEDDGNDRKERRKRACAEFGPSQNVSIVSGQVSAEDRVGKHRAERCQKIAERDLLNFDLVTFDLCFESRLLYCLFQKVHCVPSMQQIAGASHL